MSVSHPIRPVKGSRHTVEITDIALPNGHGVARLAGYVLFVPGTIPGDRVTVNITDPRKNFGFAVPVTFDRYSPDRSEPFCPHFGSCGGCTLQYLPYAKQLEAKERYLRESLRRLAAVDMETVGIMPITPSPDIHHYRSKLELAFGGREGEVLLGFRERAIPNSRYEALVVPVKTCKVFSPAIERLIPVATRFFSAGRLPPYNPRKRDGFLRHLVIRESKSTGQLMIILETTTGRDLDLAPLWRSLKDEVPETASLYRSINKGPTDHIRYEKVMHVAGNPIITEAFDRFTFHIHPQTFFQPNPRAAQLLCKTITDLGFVGQGESLLGLYCGTGPFEIALSPLLKSVIGVDSVPENITGAIENSRINMIDNCTFLSLPVEKLTRDALPAGPDAILLDPPRGGISGEALQTILRIAPRKVIYISCSPSTLARDVKLLGEKGYVLETAAPFDFFPHTSHMESLLYLRRR